MGRDARIPSSTTHSPIHHNNKNRYIIMKHSEMIQRYATPNVAELITHQRALKKLAPPIKKIIMCKKHTIMKTTIKSDPMK